MLVAAFEVEIGGFAAVNSGRLATTAAQLVPESIQTSSVSRPLLRPSGSPSAAGVRRRVPREPDARAVLLDEVGESAHDFLG